MQVESSRRRLLPAYYSAITCSCFVTISSLSVRVNVNGSCCRVRILVVAWALLPLLSVVALQE